MIPKRRTYGEYLTPIQIFEEFILPEIKDYIYQYIWVDLFAGEGNLILPILNLIPEHQRIEFFKKHIFLFDIQKELVEKAIYNAERYGIPSEVARKNICQRDTIKDYPVFLFGLGLPIYHITNPPYLYVGCVVKHPETQDYLDYFLGENAGYQDLYQVCLINDLRYGIKNMIYVIPSNFLFGFSVSNKIRNDFLLYYNIKRAVIFEKEIFEFTGTNVMICFFARKDFPKRESLSFEGIKINKTIQKKQYMLEPKNKYRAGSDFEDFVNIYKASKPLQIKYYLTAEEVEKEKGTFKVEVLDVCSFKDGTYPKTEILVNEYLFNKIKTNILFIRTVDTGTSNGRVGLYKIKEIFRVDGLLVTKEKYRTHPIQIFIEPELLIEEQILLKDYFNLILEHFRRKTDSEFMRTYKYSNSEYTRKYLGLSQAKKLIQTFPLLNLNENEKAHLKSLVYTKNIEKIIIYLKSKIREPSLFL
jgi:hypothetical protein